MVQTKFDSLLVVFIIRTWWQAYRQIICFIFTRVTQFSWHSKTKFLAYAAVRTVNSHLRFRRICCLHIQGLWSSINLRLRISCKLIRNVDEYLSTQRRTLGNINFLQYLLYRRQISLWWHHLYFDVIKHTKNLSNTHMYTHNIVCVCVCMRSMQRYTQAQHSSSQAWHVPPSSHNFQVILSLP
jgi:hypothetical protein